MKPYEEVYGRKDIAGIDLVLITWITDLLFNTCVVNHSVMIERTDFALSAVNLVAVQRIMDTVFNLFSPGML